MTGLTFLLVFLLITILISVSTYYLRKVHVPSVVTAMIIGIIVSPNSIFFPVDFDLIDKLNDLMGSSYPTVRLYTVLDALGQLGLVFLMTLAGMEVSIRLLLSEKRAVILLSILTFAMPALAGYFAYNLFRSEDTIGKWVYASLFASHSIGIVFPVIRELKIAATRFGVVVLASTIITDIASLILFAVCVQLQRQKLTHDGSASIIAGISLFDHVNLSWMGNWFIVVFVAIIMIYLLLALWLVPKLAKHITMQVSATDDLRLTFFLVIVLAVVFVGELVGVSLIVGAFIAGMAIVQAPGFHDHGKLMFKKMEGIGYGLIIPIMFFNIGLKTDLGILGTAWGHIGLVLVTVFALVGSKVLSGWLAMVLAGFTKRKGLCAGLMTVPQLSATIAAADVAKQLEMIPPEFFNTIIVLSIATTIPIPPLVKYLIVRYKISFTQSSSDVEKYVRDLTDEKQKYDETYI